jgi:hypothetical protein
MRRNVPRKIEENSKRLFSQDPAAAAVRSCATCTYAAAEWGCRWR